jgi:hypothetical protein
MDVFVTLLPSNAKEIKAAIKYYLQRILQKEASWNHSFQNEEF